ncbi:hypothetical protein QTP88_010648 [Uroleucon formosanum]
MSNSVHNLINIKFSSLSLEQKLTIKNDGRPLPELKDLKTQYKKGKNEYFRNFNTTLYLKNKWLCGCEIKQALFCFPCLLFGGETAWTKIGVTDLQHLNAKIVKHENSFKHIHNATNLNLLGKVDIRHQIDIGYKIGIQRHNELVDKNRYVLDKILNCIKCCGKHELPLRGHDEKTSSKNQGVFRGILDLCIDLDSSLRDHFEKSTVFRGTSKTIQNDLLDSILSVCRNKIVNEIQQSEFISIIVDETTDISNIFQLVLILRYEVQGRPVERFWGFENPNGHNAEALSQTIFGLIDPLLEKSPNKLIAQSYDGAAVMSGQKAGVNVKIKEKYPFAYFIHCYAHQLNLIMIQSISKNKQVRVFFSNLSEIPVFFSHSPQRVSVLDEVVGVRMPRVVQTRWNFNSRTVNTVFEHREDLIICMDKIIETSLQAKTINQATGIKRLLEDSDFIFWLNIFHKIMPHVDCLYSSVQARKTDPVQVNNSVTLFINEINKIRDNMSSICSTILNQSEIIHSNKRKTSEDPNITKRTIALEVCDVLITQAKGRFSFNEHLTTALLFQNEYYPKFNKKFPTDYFQKTLNCYPFFTKERLKTELEVIYSRDDFRLLKGIIPTIDYIISNNMNDLFKEVLKLLKLLVVIPMTSSEAERGFSTLKRIKTCLRSTMGEDRLNALSILSIESEMIAEDIEFNKKAAYESFLRIFQEFLPLNYAELKIITDFERGLMNAVESTFSESRFQGCWFHYCQSIVRYCRRSLNSVFNLFQTSPEVAKILCMILALPHPPAEVQPNCRFTIFNGFEVIVEFANQHSNIYHRLDIFLNGYIAEFWLMQIGVASISVYVYENYIKKKRIEIN